MQKTDENTESVYQIITNDHNTQLQLKGLKCLIENILAKELAVNPTDYPSKIISKVQRVV